MSETPRPPVREAEYISTAATPEWQAKLIAKVTELRTAGKRAILLIDGTRIFVFAAEPRGTIALD